VLWVLFMMSTVTGDRDVVTEADVDTDGLYLSDDELDRDDDRDGCFGGRENNWDPATWCGCQS
jgi:hypothetical protein